MEQRIAQVVFDLPLEGVFDYLIPAHFHTYIQIGMSVQVFFGPRKQIGIVTGLIQQSAIEKLKPVAGILSRNPVLDQAQLDLALDLSRYYGCSYGEALFTILRGCEGQKAVEASVKINQDSPPSLYLNPLGQYESVLTELLTPLVKDKQRVLILVPDQYVQASVEAIVQKLFSKNDYVIGSRSAVFRSLAGISLVVMVEEENSSYKQEQSPMYQTRDVLLMRAKREKVNIAFVSTVPSVEMMDLVEQKRVVLIKSPIQTGVKPQVIDLNNYKNLWRGLLSPAIANTLDQNLSKGLKSILVFNHRGSYAVTRCTECDFVLKCERCQSAVMYSRIKKQYLCRHCSFQLPGDTVCPQCRKPSWKSFGLGVEQLQKALQERFPTSRINTFERETEAGLKPCDILIGTRVLLRFKAQIKADLVALLDIDGELNRLDLHSCFNAWSLVQYLKGMAKSQLLVQTRNRDHYVMKAIAQDSPKVFYDEDMKIRRELKVSPFGHQVSVQMRCVDEKLTEKRAQELYQWLNGQSMKAIEIHAPIPEAVARKRGQYRMNILLQGTDVVGMIALIKSGMAQLKRSAKVKVSINVD